MEIIMRLKLLVSIVLMTALLAIACGKKQPATVQLTDQEMQDRIEAYYNAPDQDSAWTFLADDFKIYFDSWDAQPIEMEDFRVTKGWDFALNAQDVTHHLTVYADTIAGYMHETNDFARLIDFDGWMAEVYWVFDKYGKIKAELYVPIEQEPTFSELLQSPMDWLAENRPEALAELRPEGNLVLSAENARKWRPLLEAWREATGRDSVLAD
jgi:hypothetical protein